MRLQALLWVGSGSIGIGRVRSDLLDLRALGVWDSMGFEAWGPERKDTSACT